MSNRFKILCPECNSPAILAKTNNISTRESLLQCCCSDSECGHCFVFSRSYSHGLNEPRLKQPPSIDLQNESTHQDKKSSIICPACCGTATINKSNRKHTLIYDLYCSCKNPLCEHRFVSTLSFSHSLSPSAAKHGRLVQDLINSIPPDERGKAIDMLRNASHSLKNKE